MKQEHSPKRATLMSTFLPGLGQAYNKKYWKIPFVYGLIGGFVYAAQEKHNEFVYLFGESQYRVENNGATLHEEFENVSDLELNTQRESAKRWRNNYYLFALLSYGFNILDANVDAHFYSFDVGKDLTLQALPYQEVMQKDVYTGISLRLKLKK